MVQLKINQSVGIGGVNNANDVKALQAVLNSLLALIKPTTCLAVDGRLAAVPANSKTVAAIKRFQSQVLNMVRPDGRADVNGRTHRKINEKLISRPNRPSTPVFTTTLPWMKTARDELGQTEVRGARANARILEYFTASSFWGSDDSGGANAWCGSFVAWVMKKNGYTPVRDAFRAKEWKAFGKEIATPVHGAIAIKSRSGGGHVAFVVGKSSDGKALYMLGGNQSDSVNIARYDKSVWEKFVVPNDFDETTATLPIYSKSAASAGSET